MVTRAERMALIESALVGTAAGKEEPSVLAERAVKIADAVTAVLVKERETAETVEIFQRVHRLTDDVRAMRRRALGEILGKLPKTDALELSIESHFESGEHIVKTKDEREVVLDVNAAGEVHAKYWPRKYGEAIDPKKVATRTLTLEFDDASKEFVGKEQAHPREREPRRSALAVIAELVVNGLRESGAQIELTPSR